MSTLLSLLWLGGSIYLFYRYGWKKWQPWAFLFIVAYAIGGTKDKTAESAESSTSDSEPYALNQADLNELQAYLNFERWTCTGFEKGSVPFMQGATFKFSNQGVTVYSEGTTANNRFKITRIVPDFPKGCKYSAESLLNIILIMGKIIFEQRVDP